MKKLKIIHLSITDWGASLGGEHFYAKMWYTINGERKALELSTILTAKDAKRLNEKDKEEYYQEGESTIRFNTIDDIVDEALSQSKKLGLEVDLMLSGSGGFASVSEPLWSRDKKIYKRIKELYDKAEEIGWYSHPKYPEKLRDEKMEAIDDEFNSILETGIVK